MNLDVFGIPLICLQVAVLVYVIVRGVRLLSAGGASMVAVFFLFAAISMLLSDLYWITYDLLRLEIRMPFAANEIAEAALFLLLASMLNVAIRPAPGDALREMILTALFAAASTALWIAWTGEWADDLLAGLTFGYLLCCIARAIRLTGAFSRAEWIGLGAGAAALILLQATIFFVPAALGKILDLCCYVLMFLGVGFIFTKAVRSARAGADSRKQLSLTACCYGLAVSAMFMSEGVCYLVLSVFTTLSYVLMMNAVQKEVAQA